MDEKQYYTLEDEQNNSDHMIFPLNIHESLNASTGLSQSEKNGIIISFWIVGCLILMWFCAIFLKSIIPNFYIQITILIIVILNLTVGVLLLRFLLDDRSIMNEYQNIGNNSFANYFRIYRDTELEINNKYGIIEYDDGTYAAILRLRMGYNTDEKAANTWTLNRDAFRIIAKAGFPYQIISESEFFRESDSCDLMLDKLTQIDDPMLFKAQKDIIKEILDIAENESNVPITHILIYAPTQILRDDLPQLITRLERHYASLDSCFRDIKFLDNDEIIAFLRSYYQLEVLDMSLLRAQTVINDLSIGDSFKVLRLYGMNGKVYSTQSLINIHKDIIRQTGIKKVTK